MSSINTSSKNIYNTIYEKLVYFKEHFIWFNCIIMVWPYSVIENFTDCIRIKDWNGNFYEIGNNRIENGYFDIWWYDCQYIWIENYLTISFKNKKFHTTYFWNIKEYIKNNEINIAKYFTGEIEKDLRRILEKFSGNFDFTIKELSEIILPNTKEIILSEVLVKFKENASKVADLFEDKTIKTTLFKLFKS